MAAIAEGNGPAPFVRVAQASVETLKRALEAGAYGIIAPMINTMRFMAPNTPWLRFRRNFILWLSGFYKPARKWVDSGKMSIPFTYQETPILTPDLPGENWEGAPALGAKPPDAALTVIRAGQAETTFLRRLFGGGFVALYFDGKDSSAEAFLDQLAQSPLKFPLTVYPVTKTSSTNPQVILDSDEKLTKAFSARAGMLYLFRPDGHLALRRQNGKALDLLGFLEKLEK